MSVHDAATLAKALHGKKSGSGWVACCPAHDDRNPSLSISCKGGTVVWHCHAGCTQDAVLSALRAKGLWSGHSSFEIDHAERERERERDRQERESRINAAVRLWHQSVSIDGTLAADYLKGRGITVALPDSLRFHPALSHPCGAMLPAMIGLVVDVNGKPLGISRTFLDLATGGKIAFEPKRMFMGAITGGAVRLAPWHDGSPLLLSEGIETGMSASQLTGWPCWSCLSTSGLKSIKVPPVIREVTILVDRDVAGERAARALAERLVREGRSVKRARPPAGCNDFNDALAMIGRAV